MNPHPIMLTQLRFLHVELVTYFLQHDLIQIKLNTPIRSSPEYSPITSVIVTVFKDDNDNIIIVENVDDTQNYSREFTELRDIDVIDTLTNAIKLEQYTKL